MRSSRLLSLALLFTARRRLRAEDAAQQFRVSVRTVYRDIAALLEAGFPVVGTPGDGYVLAAGAQFKAVAVTPEEAEALALAGRLLQREADGALRAHLESALAKLETGLSLDAARRVRRLGARVRLPSDGGAGPLSTVLAALDAQQVLRLEYAGVRRQDVTVREVEPLGLVRLSTAWLMPAWCRLREGVRVFRSDRIRSAVPTGAHFVPRPGATFEDLVRRHLEGEAG